MATSDIHARTTTEAQLIDRAMKAPAFRAELVADPTAVFRRELGMQVPDSIDVQVLQEPPSTVDLVLPPAGAGANTELTDAELTSVSGGWTALTECVGTWIGQQTCDNRYPTPGG